MDNQLNEIETGLNVSFKRKFVAYWNIPSSDCNKYEIKFTNLNKKYGIIQNNNDIFLGEKYVILYDPGNFPAYIKDKKTNTITERNGGIPVAGDLKVHIEKFTTDIKKQIKHPKSFDGICCIDFESWRPIFQQNYGECLIYKQKMLEFEAIRYPGMLSKELEIEAAKNWEESSKMFVEQTLKLARSLLPNAKIGYYAFPYVFNNDGEIDCSDRTKAGNDRLKYIWDLVDIIFPSVYLSEELPVEKRRTLVRGRILEAKRIAANSNRGQKILTYIWFVYRNQPQNFLSEYDLRNALEEMRDGATDGVVLWGSSSNFDSKEKCIKFEKYVKEVLGPILKEFTEN